MQARAWLSVGWRVDDVSLTGRRLRFVRDNGSGVAQRLPAEAFSQLIRFLGDEPLTGMIAHLEAQLNGGDDRAVLSAAGQVGFTPTLLEGSLLVRRHVGRLSELIHAAAITLALPHLLEPDEQLTKRPSLAAGNDPDRPYDVDAPAIAGA